MNIELTKEQYEYLMKLVYLGNWIAGANFYEEESGNKGKYDDFERYIYSFAKEAGLEKYIQYDEESKQFIPTLEFHDDDEINQYLGEYDNEVFWDEMIHRLAERDFEKENGEGSLEKLNPEEVFEKLEPFIEKYEEEFEVNGIDNLGIK